MTLGRTSSGAIKIKTDGNSPRAVECACCGCAPTEIDLSWYPELTPEAHAEFLRGGTITVTAQISENYLGSCSYDATEAFAIAPSSCTNGFRWQKESTVPCTNEDGSHGTFPFEFSSFDASVLSVRTKDFGVRLFLDVYGLCPSSDPYGNGGCYSIGAWVPHWSPSYYYYYWQRCGEVSVTFNSESAFSATVPLIGLFSATMSMSVEFTPNAV